MFHSDHFEPSDIKPTHRLEVELGIALPDKTWKKEKVTIECWKKDYDKGQSTTLPLREACEAKAKELFPDAAGSFINDFNWEYAEEIGPQPEFPEHFCGCMVGEGGIVQPDYQLDMDVGVAQADQTWFSIFHTDMACRDRNIDSRFMWHVEKNWPGHKYFIIKKYWDKAKKLNNNYGYSNEEWNRMIANGEVILGSQDNA
jgi:hypothetical protein